MGEYSDFRDNSNSNSEKLKRIFTQHPSFPIGIVALTAIVAHGFYNMKHRKEKLSIYLIRYRVMAQGTFLGCITLEMAFSMFREHVWKKLKKE